MKQIKFSHHYSKLVDGVAKSAYGEDYYSPKYISRATLVEVIPVQLENLSKQFLSYDTDGGIYRLPSSGSYMILVFLKGTHLTQIFTTIRRNYPEKYQYYKSSIGEEFEIVYTDVV